MASGDGEIDYSDYSLRELREVEANINAKNFPKNFANLRIAIEELGESIQVKTEIPTKDSFEFKLLRVQLDSKYIFPFRIIMIAVTLYFASVVYGVIESGVSFRRGNALVKGEDWSYYLSVTKYIFLGALPLWLATFGVKAKTN